MKMNGRSGRVGWPIGILFSETGDTAIIERTQLNGALLAIEELNSRGGIDGQPIEPIVYDPGSDPERYGRLAERLVRTDGVQIIVGCYMSSARRAVVPVVEQANALLCYPTFYEGFEYSPNVLYLGAVPNQTSVVLADFLLRNFGGRVYLVGSDYIFPRESNRLLRQIIFREGGDVVGERYLPLGASSRSFELLFRELKLVDPDVIFSTVVGDDAAKLYVAHRRAGLEPTGMPIASITTTEAELSLLEPGLAAGHLSCGTYFATAQTEENSQFLCSYRRRWGPAAQPNMCAEAAYSVVHLIAHAIHSAGCSDPRALIRALDGYEFRAPQGRIRIDSENNHAYLWSRIARVAADGSFQIIFEFPKPVKPDPYMVGDQTLPRAGNWFDWEQVSSNGGGWRDGH